GPAGRGGRIRLRLRPPGNGGGTAPGDGRGGAPGDRRPGPGRRGRRLRPAVAVTGTGGRAWITFLRLGASPAATPHCASSRTAGVAAAGGGTALPWSAGSGTGRSGTR